MADLHIAVREVRIYVAVEVLTSAHKFEETDLAAGSTRDGFC